MDNPPLAVCAFSSQRPEDFADSPWQRSHPPMLCPGSLCRGGTREALPGATQPDQVPAVHACQASGHDLLLLDAARSSARPGPHYERMRSTNTCAHASERPRTRDVMPLGEVDTTPPKHARRRSCAHSLPAAMPASSSWAATTDHATALPACFAFDECSHTVFMNGGRHVLGATPPHEEVLAYGGDGNTAVVNADLHTVRRPRAGVPLGGGCFCSAVRQPAGAAPTHPHAPHQVPARLASDDVGVTQEQWETFMGDLTTTSDALPLTDALTGALGLPGTEKHSVEGWRQAVQEVCDKHMEETFVKGVSSVSLETACWTVADPQRVSDVGDPVAVPQSMPVVRIKLQAGLYKRLAVAAGQQAQGKQGSGAGGAEGDADGPGSGSGPAAYGSSLLPWSSRGPWGVAPRIHGTAASTFHTAEPSSAA
jgi:hypothetical protein